MSADNLFNSRIRFYQQGGDMVRVGGMGYTIDVNKTIGNRITDMTTAEAPARPIDAAEDLRMSVAGWASVNEGTEGPPIYDLVESYITRKGSGQICPEHQHGQGDYRLLSQKERCDHGAA